jgi:carboxypeptidase Q
MSVCFRLSSLAPAAALLCACGGAGPEPSPAHRVADFEAAPAPPAAAAHEPDPSAAEPPALATPIADRYRDAAARIMEAALADEGAWQKLVFLTDRVGPRLSGSRALEQAIAWAADTMRAEGHENVRLQKVMVPHWVRGQESAQLVAPVSRPMQILGLGGTVATPKKGLTGEVVVVESFEELDELGDRIRGKIVLFNRGLPPYSEEEGAGYGETVRYRVQGPARAARHGAIAALVRSITASSLYTPHTGATAYEEGGRKIPAAAVTAEDAELIARLTRAGDTVRVRLTLSGRFLPDAESANVIAELRGREKPDEIVLIGAHIDSWDVGQGAHDDGGGCAIMMQALTLLRNLDMRPRRTIRVVLFTNEENGLRGARDYASEHAEEISRHVMAMESDSGVFAPRGMRVHGSDEALAHTRDIVSLLEPIGAARARPGYAGADLGPLIEEGVQALGHWVEGSRYFDIHHTHADTLDKVVPEELAQNLAAVAIVAYVIADMEERFGAPGPR